MAGLPAPQAEWQEKQQRVLHFLEQHYLDGVWLTRRANFAWYTSGGDSHVIEDYTAGEAGLLILPDKTYLITNNIEAQRLCEEETIDMPLVTGVYLWYDIGQPGKLLNSLIGRRRIGADMPLPGMDLIADEFASLRHVLTSAEQTRFRALCNECGQIVEEVARQVRSGCTEREIAAELFRRCHCSGITPVVVLVGADERIARYRHPLPKDNPVRTYAMLVLVGVRYGLQAALTRLVAVDQLPPEIDAKHHAVTRIEATYIHHTRPGRTLGQVLAIGAEAYAAEGYPGEWQKHYQGGLCGYAPREVETMPGLELMIQPYQAAAWLPSISGTKSEDTFLILPDRNEMLSNTDWWPMLEVQIDGQTYSRPDILRL
jgi:Xaa-Pro dipeptidase